MPKWNFKGWGVYHFSGFLNSEARLPFPEYIHSCLSFIVILIGDHINTLQWAVNYGIMLCGCKVIWSWRKKVLFFGNQIYPNNAQQIIYIFYLWNISVNIIVSWNILVTLSLPKKAYQEFSAYLEANGGRQMS